MTVLLPWPFSVPCTRFFCEITPAANVGSVINSTKEAMGYTSTTLPTMPSGVITAIPFSTPLVDPRSMITTFAPGARGVADDVRGHASSTATAPGKSASARARSAVSSSRAQILVLHLDAIEVRSSCACSPRARRAARNNR